ncbi:MAG: phosphate acyltransferase, partial [Sodaliphilus sp.]|nr:phosphate acyltransferase [Sodaliphilus sp.]
RPAFQVLKTAPGVNSVSGAFIIVLPEEIAKKYGEKGMLVFADCAVMPDPTEDELAQTAVLTARTAQNLAGITPRVAMLSFSTKGSAQHDKVTKMVNATAKAKALDPSIVIDGELQADAAIVDSVAQLKAPGSPVAGKATVLVFPNLEVGNIAYKLVQRLGGATAVGPILQGLAAPVNDLSRGCNADEIYKTLLITSNQAINRK